MANDHLKLLASERERELHLETLTRERERQIEELLHEIEGWREAVESEKRKLKTTEERSSQEKDELRKMLQVRGGLRLWRDPPRSLDAVIGIAFHFLLDTF